MRVIVVSRLYANTDTAKLSRLPEYETEALRLAGEGEVVVFDHDPF